MRKYVFAFRDQQIAGRAAHEHFDAGAPGQQFQFRQFSVIGRRGANEKCVIAPGPAACAAQLVGQRLLVHGERLGVGHLEDRGDAAEDGAARTGFQVFLVFQPRLAEVYLGVDDSRQDS